MIFEALTLRFASPERRWKQIRGRPYKEGYVMPLDVRVACEFLVFVRNFSYSKTRLIRYSG